MNEEGGPVSCSGSEECCIIFFVKLPEPGTVKSRLVPHVSKDLAAELYRNFVLDHLSTLDLLPIPVLIFFSPPGARREFAEWLGTERSYSPQREGDLGHRMKGAFSAAFSLGFEKVVLMGSDLPDLPSTIIEDAVDSLDSHDTVLGPTTDGGYYLIGFRSKTFYPSVFEGVPWSTSEVFNETMAILQSSHLEIHVLREWCDVDTIEDLVGLYHRNMKSGFRNSRTMDLLVKLPLRSYRTKTGK